MGFVGNCKLMEWNCRIWNVFSKVKLTTLVNVNQSVGCIFIAPGCFLDSFNIHFDTFIIIMTIPIIENMQDYGNIPTKYHASILSKRLLGYGSRKATFWNQKYKHQEITPDLLEQLQQNGNSVNNIIWRYETSLIWGM